VAKKESKRAEQTTLDLLRYIDGEAEWLNGLIEGLVEDADLRVKASKRINNLKGMTHEIRSREEAGQ